MPGTEIRLADVLRTHRAEILQQWLAELQASGSVGDSRNRIGQLQSQAEEFLTLLSQGTATGRVDDLDGGDWGAVRQFLDTLSSERARQGFSSSQTATFIFSLKRPLFMVLRREVQTADGLAAATWETTELLDKLGLLTVTAFQRVREEVIVRQQEEMLELSTPVVSLWDGVLALPMIGTLDSARTQVVMETLLQRIVETGAEIAILDITGVPTVDTLVAQHLIKTVTAIRLMGSDCIISGVRPQIAQTIVHLGVNLQGITTKATLADALALALERTGRTVVTRSA